MWGKYFPKVSLCIVTLYSKYSRALTVANCVGSSPSAQDTIPASPLVFTLLLGLPPCCPLFPA